MSYSNPEWELTQIILVLFPRADNDNKTQLLRIKIPLKSCSLSETRGTRVIWSSAVQRKTNISNISAASSKDEMTFLIQYNSIDQHVLYHLFWGLESWGLSPARNDFYLKNVFKIIETIYLAAKDRGKYPSWSCIPERESLTQTY